MTKTTTLGCGRRVRGNPFCGMVGCGQPDCDCCRVWYCADCEPMFCRCTTPQPLPSGMCNRCKHLIRVLP